MLLSILIATRLLLNINTPVIYHFDSYAYLLEAIDFSSTGKIQIDVGMPFIFYLGVLYYIFGSTLGTILFTRLSMLIISALLVYIIYLFGLKISGKMFGFLAALLAIFEPFFLYYSIVPHNDVFGTATGLTALYLATSNTKLYYYLSPIFFYISISTRPELFLVLIIPIFLFNFFKHLKNYSAQSLIKFVFFTFIYVLPCILLYPYMGSYTRFSIIEKFILFMTPGLLKKTLDFSFAFYDQNLGNQVVFTLVVLGLALGLYNIAVKIFNYERRRMTFLFKYKQGKSLRDVLLSDQVTITFCIFLSFVLYLIIITVFGYGYIIVDGTLQINQRLPNRYLIFPRLLISYPLAYAFTKVAKKVQTNIVH